MRSISSVKDNAFDFVFSQSQVDVDSGIETMEVEDEARQESKHKKVSSSVCHK